MYHNDTDMGRKLNVATIRMVKTLYHQSRTTIWVYRQRRRFITGIHSITIWTMQKLYGIKYNMV